MCRSPEAGAKVGTREELIHWGAGVGQGARPRVQLVMEREGLTLLYFPEKNKIFEPVSYAMKLSRVHETTAHLGNGSHGSVCSVTV